MAKPKRRSSSRQSKHFSTSKRAWLFLISVVLIGFMMWQVIMTLSSSSHATFPKPGICHREHGNGVGWGGFSLCNVGNPNGCMDECTCVPFRPDFKFGRCVVTAEITPAPTATLTPAPPGMLTCGEICDTDSQCASGYCHDPNWQACPTETPIPVTPTCAPRPKCLDSKPSCLPPEPIGGFCPPNVTPTLIPTSVPKPTHICGVRGSSAVAVVKTCRDRSCFDGEQCACPVPSGDVACTADAKLCPDGSYVGRYPPSCDFKPCPGQ